MKPIAPDKKRHFWAGLIMGALVQAVCWQVFPKGVIAVIFTLGIVIAVSYGFELFSKFTGRGHYEVMDAVFTVAGSVAGMLMALLLLNVLA